MRYLSLFSGIEAAHVAWERGPLASLRCYYGESGLVMALVLRYSRG